MRIPVPLIVFVFGLLLTGLGLLAYFAFAVAEDRSWTALIPAFWGVPIATWTRNVDRVKVHIAFRFATHPGRMISDLTIVRQPPAVSIIRDNLCYRRGFHNGDGRVRRTRASPNQPILETLLD